LSDINNIDIIYDDSFTFDKLSVADIFIKKFKTPLVKKVLISQN
jgi:hypothetical protein